MIVTVQNKYRVEAELTESELIAYGITYEEMDYKNAETRRVLWTIYDEIKKLGDVSISFSGRLLIEVIKDLPDKYRICFTALDAKDTDRASLKQMIKSEEPPVVAEFSCFEDLLDAVRAIRCEYSGSLYEKNGVYRLICNVPSLHKEKTKNILGEFSVIVKNPIKAQSQCNEFWNCITENDAIKRVNGCFLRNQQPLSCHL